MATFGYNLYSSDVILPYRLRGIHAVDRDTRRMTARCILFLRSNMAYEWPPRPDSLEAGCLKGLALFFGIPLGVAVMVCSLSFAATREYRMTVLVNLGGLGLILMATWLAFFRLPDAQQWWEWRAAGEFGVWPFLRQKDFDRARKGQPERARPPDDASNLAD
jgi:hypothetical protein